MRLSRSFVFTPILITFIGIVPLVLHCGDLSFAHGVVKAAQKSKPNASPQISPTPIPTPKASAPVASTIVFDPPAPAILPGSRIQVMASVRNEKGAEIPSLKITSAEVDPAYRDYLNVSQDKTNPNAIIIIGLTGPTTSSSAIPYTVPVIAKYISGTTAIANVLNVQLGTAIPPPAPIPTNSPQVDVMWTVLPNKIVKDNFGSRMGDQYYGIGIVIGNNSGYSLQLASVGFKVPAITNQMCDQQPCTAAQQQYIPAANYQVTRATIVREETLGWRALTVSGLPALGTLIGGFTPFFHATNPKANFTQFVSLFTGPLSAGVPAVWPNTVSGHLVRLDQQALRNDNQNARTIIENNTQYASVTFFPRHILDSYFESKYPQTWKKERDDPIKVMVALGEMVLIGEQVHFVNRIRLNGGAVTQPTVSQSPTPLSSPMPSPSPMPSSTPSPSATPSPSPTPKPSPTLSATPEQLYRDR